MGNEGQRIADKIREELNKTSANDKIDKSIENTTKDSDMHQEGAQNSAPVQLNNITLLMSIITILVMVCSALFFVATV